MIIFDFDDTLFDTHSHKDLRHRALRTLGIDEETYKRTYLLARNTPDGLCTYSNKRHAEMLEVEGYDEDTAFRLLEDTTTPARLSSLLLPGARALLERMKSVGKTLVLLSLGDPSFQELKVHGSGIALFFDRVFMVDDTKEHVLRELFSVVAESSAWFINDKVKETAKLRAAFPDMKIVLRQSPNIPAQEYEESGLPYFKTLHEIETYVAERI